MLPRRHLSKNFEFRMITNWQRPHESVVQNEPRPHLVPRTEAAREHMEIVQRSMIDGTIPQPLGSRTPDLLSIVEVNGKRTLAFRYKFEEPLGQPREKEKFIHDILQDAEFCLWYVMDGLRYGHPAAAS